MAKKLTSSNHRDFQLVNAAILRKNDVIFIEAKDIIPCDAEITLRDVHPVDESAITGESSFCNSLAEYGGDFMVQLLVEQSYYLIGLVAK